MFNKQRVTQLCTQYSLSVHNKLELTQLSCTAAHLQCKTHWTIHNSTCTLQQLYSTTAINLTSWKTKHHWAVSDLRNSRTLGEAVTNHVVSTKFIWTSNEDQNIGTKMGDHARLQYQVARFTKPETPLYYPVNSKWAFPTWANRFPSGRSGRLERWHRTTRWQSSSTVLKKRRVGSNASRSITSSKNRSQ